MQSGNGIMMKLEVARGLREQPDSEYRRDLIYRLM
jgi:hypothetical protein